MISFFAILLRLFFQIFRSKRIILSENALLKKENDILLRRVGKKRVHFNVFDKMNMSRSIMVSDRIRGAATNSEAR
jgi:hypothetical protein